MAIQIFFCIILMACYLRCREQMEGSCIIIITRKEIYIESVTIQEERYVYTTAIESCKNMLIPWDKHMFTIIMKTSA